jgi:hypothetical protein
VWAVRAESHHEPMRGTDPWLVIGVALIAATAAIIGAVIAAVTAGKRQKRELEHDRDLATLDDRRVVLDEAAQLLLRLKRDIENAELVTFTPEFKYEFPSTVDERWAEIQHVEARLIIRLGIDHRATEAFREVVRAIEELRNWFANAEQEYQQRLPLGLPPTGGKEERARVREAIASFLVEAKRAAS